MSFTLNYYRDYRPEGRIYISCEGVSEDKKVIYVLFQGNTLIEKMTGEGSQLVGFSIPGPGTFKLSAQVFSADQRIDELNTPDIVIPAVVNIPPPPPLEIKSLKGELALVHGVDNYLRVKFIECGFDKLKNEKQCAVPIYYTLRNRITFVPLFSRDAIEKQSKAMPTLLNLSGSYKVTGSISDDYLLALAQELQQLEYVEYCCLSSKLIGATRPNRVVSVGNTNSADNFPDDNTLSLTAEPEQIISDEESGDVQAAPLVNTPNFTQQQLYLNPGMGLNVRTAWARNATGQNIRVHLAEARIVDHEDLVNSATVVQQSTTPGNSGTANLGILRANNNGFGITGIAFNAKAFTYAEENLRPLVANVRPGDIVAINSYYLEWVRIDFLPIVHNIADWDLVSQLVRAGAVVIFSSGEAFGSPEIGHNLRTYSLFNDWGNSGAIMACGCIPATGRRSTFTNYNLYQMLNAWDIGITTTGGWRNLIFDQPPIPFRRYTSNWDTSSAPTAMIAGAMAQIQSYARERYGVVFNTKDMLFVIESTGSRQAQGQMIGVRPNVAEALRQVDFLLGNGLPPPPPPPPYPAWDSAQIQYEVGDRVIFQQFNFQCAVRHISSPALQPLNAPSIWWKVTQPQTYSPWEIGAEYIAGQRVTYQGINYQCLQRHVSAVAAWAPPENPLLWVKI